MTEAFTMREYPHFIGVGNPKVKRYTLRVTLRYVKPSIYRKFEVPSNISLRHLGDLILELMGWENEHLNAFRTKDATFVPYYQSEGGFGFRGKDYYQEEYAVEDILNVKGKSVVFEYDFGDGWEHEVKLSSIGEYAPGEKPVVKFIKGENACPPEDCGGPWGYAELVDILHKKQNGEELTEDENDRLDWYGMMVDDGLGPTDFDPVMAEIICEGYSE